MWSQMVAMGPKIDPIHLGTWGTEVPLSSEERRLASACARRGGGRHARAGCTRDWQGCAAEWREQWGGRGAQTAGEVAASQLCSSRGRGDARVPCDAAAFASNRRCGGNSDDHKWPCRWPDNRRCGCARAHDHSLCHPALHSENDMVTECW
eukprot:COSAG02_NODE_286_length_25649_cov_13.411272_21_plen_151_part_00